MKFMIKETSKLSLVMTDMISITDCNICCGKVSNIDLINAVSTLKACEILCQITQPEYRLLRSAVIDVKLIYKIGIERGSFILLRSDREKISKAIRMCKDKVNQKCIIDFVRISKFYYDYYLASL